MTDDLAAFIAARLDEDEAGALAASPGPWHLNAEGDEVMAVDDITAAEAFALSNNQQRATAAHIARHDPARVLREVAVKRARLERYFSAARAADKWRTEGGSQAVETILIAIYKEVQHDAAIWSDHPDYRAEWKPGDPR